MRAAHALQVAARNLKYELTVVGIPKTMDNDILWVWQSFGFLSAVEKAKEFIMQLHTEAKSNPRLCVMQLFGSDSGFVVSHAALASRAVDLALIPEIYFSMEKVAACVKKRLSSLYNEGRSPYGMVLMSETAIPTDFQKYIDRDEKLPFDQKVLRLEQEEKEEIARYHANNRRVRGQTPDALRTGGLKIVSRVLQQEIKAMDGDYWKSFRVFTNEPRHLLRSLDPSASDMIFGHRLGCLAVDNAMAGYTDFMVSQWLTEFVLVPLRLVVLGRKRVPTEGIFWRSVLDITGQEADLT
jgi:6-phosphofructokinase 1